MKDGTSFHRPFSLFVRLLTERPKRAGVSLAFFCSFLKAYLSIQSIEHLSRLLKSSFKDLIDVFPQGKKTRSALDAHFRAEGLVQVADWYGKRQTVLVKEELSRWMAQACDEEEFNEEWKENVRLISPKGTSPRHS